MRGESVTDHRNFVRSGIEEPTVKVIDLRRVHGQEGEAGMEFLPGVDRCLAISCRSSGSVHLRYSAISPTMPGT